MALVANAQQEMNNHCAQKFRNDSDVCFCSDCENECLSLTLPVWWVSGPCEGPLAGVQFLSAAAAGASLKIS